MSRLLVTGGAGFIGSNFVHYWIARHPDDRIVVLDSLTYAGNLANLEAAAQHPGFRFVHGDIRDQGLVESLLREEELDSIIHLAAESHVDRSISGPDIFVDVNIKGTHSLLKAARRAWMENPGTDPERYRFHHVSTDEVYGSIEEGSWPETHPVSPNSPYSASKAGSDLLALAYHRTHGVPVLVTRCSNNYGPYQFPEKVIPLFVTNLIDGLSVPLYGDGGNVRDWLHVDDHCHGIQLVLEGGRPGEVYNIGGGTEMSNRELTGLLLDACGADWSSVEHVTDRKGHDRRYSVDISKIAGELGYAPRVPFTDGLAATAAWYRDNRAWWETLKQWTAAGVSR